MVNNTEQGIQDLKSLKQHLQTLKDQRIDFVIRLGELTHKQIRESKNVTIENLKNLSDEILNKDIQIYQTQKSITKLNASNLQCSKCKQSVTESMKFCGNCGTINPHFVDPNAQYVNCKECQQEIDAAFKYCPCCGAKQEVNQ